MDNKVFKTSLDYKIVWDEKYLTILKNGEVLSKTLKKDYVRIHARGIVKRKNKLLYAFYIYLIIPALVFIEDYEKYDRVYNPSYNVTYVSIFIAIVFLVFVLINKKQIDEENEMYKKNESELTLYYMNGNKMTPHIVKGTIEEIKKINEEIDFMQVVDVKE